MSTINKINTIYNKSAEDFIAELLLLEAEGSNVIPDVYFYEYCHRIGKYDQKYYHQYVKLFPSIAETAKDRIIAIGEYQDDHFENKNPDYKYSHKIKWIKPSCNDERFIYIWSKTPIENIEITEITSDYQNCCRDSDFACPLPDDLVKTLLNSFVPEGSLVSDVYSGSGKISRWCKRLDIDFISCEIEKESCEKSIEILATIVSESEMKKDEHFDPEVDGISENEERNLLDDFQSMLDNAKESELDI